MVADLAQHVDAGERVAVARQDGLHVLGRQVRPVQLPLLGGQPAEQDLRQAQECSWKVRKVEIANTGCFRRASQMCCPGSTTRQVQPC